MVAVLHFSTASFRMVRLMVLADADAMYQPWSQICLSCTPWLLQWVMPAGPARQLASYDCVKRQEKFMLFSDHNGSLLRRQPKAITIGHSPRYDCVGICQNATMLQAVKHLRLSQIRLLIV